ncbi:ATPase [Streptomyces sp. 150FB]|uniref:MinD/ParA family ATP-binding protein n=1 Tax=Streptomyces sp. 150FB TaxID=1576605 RepID=UPI000589043E|nr:MinD/ParA family protein [Streptomyces sp. 150FB]KIF75048.1 ATPase [Streptomyces sp. 150FB]
MPNGDNWQGDVLRSLRGGTTPQGAPQQGPAGEPPGGPEAGHQPQQGQPGQEYQAREYQAQEYQGQEYAAQGYPQQGDPAQGFPVQQQPYQQQQQPPQQHQQPQQQQRQQQQQQQPYVRQDGPAYEAASQAPQAYAPPQQGGYTPGTRPHRTPDSRPVLDKGLAAAGRKPRHGEGMASRALRGLRRTVSSSAAREVAETTAIAEILQQPVTTGRQIAVTSIRGGAGKSTLAALLGTTYAHYRQDPVLVVEADPALGSLPLRLGAETLRWTTGDLADIVEPQMSLLDVTGYLVQLPGNAWLLPGSQGQIGAMLDSKAYERVMISLRRYFGMTVIDCETLPAEVARVALSASQARILAAPATLEGITSTYAVLQWMQGLPPHVIAGTVVVLTELVPHAGLDVAKAAQKLTSTGASVQVMPYDRHLAAGGAIRTELLAHETREAATRLAADVFRLSQQRH